MKSLADIKRKMTLGSKWHCVSNGYDMGIRRISGVYSNRVTFETMRRDGEIVHSTMDYPKASEIEIINDNTFVINRKYCKLTYSFRG